MEFESKLAELGEFWEKIEFPNGVTVGKSRSKKLLWSKYLYRYFSDREFEGQTILDVGCNAGGNIIELSKHRPAKILGIEGAEMYLRQAEFVIGEFGLDAQIRNYNLRDKTPEEHASTLGSFDVIFCLGIIYHLAKDDNLSLLKYIKDNSARAIFSTQTFISENRPTLGWETTEQGTRSLFEEAGFGQIQTIYMKDPEEGWAGLTNEWYFEAYA